MRRLAALVLASATLAACGNDDDPGSAGTTTQAPAATATQPSVTREAFIAEVDAFCKRVNDEGRALNVRIERIARSAVASGASERAVVKEVAPVLREGYDAQRTYTRQFLEFEPPAADEQAFGKLREIVEEQTGVFGRVVRAAEAGDLARYGKANTELQTVAARRKTLFQGYGFKSCGGGATQR